jgi:hypothetical protein
MLRRSLPGMLSARPVLAFAADGRDLGPRVSDWKPLLYFRSKSMARIYCGHFRSCDFCRIQQSLPLRLWEVF